MEFYTRLEQWRSSRALNAMETTQKFHREICKVILKHWLDHHQECDSITLEQVMAFAERVAHYSPSRWNAIVGILRFITPHGKELKPRALKLTRKPPPSPMEFQRVLFECDRHKRTKAGIVIAFLANTGMRIQGARRVRWEEVFENRIEYIAKGGRRCSVPILETMRPVLERLRAMRDSTGYVLPRGDIRKALQRACERAGVRKLSHHDFRHLFTTRCIESGVDVPTVARWRGDSDGGAMLSKRYFHLLDSHSYAMAARVKIGVAA